MTLGNPVARPVRRLLRGVRLPALGILAGLLVGCAHAPLNVPLARIDPSAGYRPQTAPNRRDGTGLMVALFFSGGGTRAAAFSYGVLRELAATIVADDRRMLDEVTTINAVSGGSFTAAYYCLYGDRIFADYEQLFLKRDVQSDLLRRCLSPVNSARLSSPYFGRSDLAAEYYDELLFHGAAFGDLAAIGAARPFLVINATNISTGTPLQFTQDQFDLIGSDLNQFPISRAVAASSAVPLLLTPIILKNYADSVPTAGLVLFESGRKFRHLRRLPGRADRDRAQLPRHGEASVHLPHGRRPHGQPVAAQPAGRGDLVRRLGGRAGARCGRRGITKLAIIVVDATVEVEAKRGPARGDTQLPVGDPNARQLLDQPHEQGNDRAGRRQPGRPWPARAGARTKGFGQNIPQTVAELAVFDASGFARPRKANGEWQTPFDPFNQDSFVEGNAWQYTWFVPQDVPGLVEAMGRDRFVSRLNEAFEKSAPTRFNAAGDRFWLYPLNQGNQPTMHVAWLFNWAGKPWLTQKWARAILDAYYGHNPADAYLGDEDQGQMSAWFVMSAMGLFQTDGGCRVDPIYELGSPLYPKVVLHLSKEYYGGKTFTVIARNASRTNCYVQSAKLNGRPLDSWWIPPLEVVRGGSARIRTRPAAGGLGGHYPAAASPGRAAGKWQGRGCFAAGGRRSTLASAAAGSGTIWPSEPPTNCPFKPTKSVTAFVFTGRHAEYTHADTWYPSWAADGKMYSPWTDGNVNGLRSNSGGQGSHDRLRHDHRRRSAASCTCDQGVYKSDPAPYAGRYPCGSLVLQRRLVLRHLLPASGGQRDARRHHLQLAVAGAVRRLPLVHRFRQDVDADALHAGQAAVRRERPAWRAGQDRLAALRGFRQEHGALARRQGVSGGPRRARRREPPLRLQQLDHRRRDLPAARHAGHREHERRLEVRVLADGAAAGRSDFAKIKPIAAWRDHMGCVTMTYNAPLKKYLMCVTDGGNTAGYSTPTSWNRTASPGRSSWCSTCSTSASRAISLNIPSKFISADGRTLWLCYAANFAQTGSAANPVQSARQPLRHVPAGDQVTNAIDVSTNLIEDWVDKDEAESASAGWPSSSRAASALCLQLAKGIPGR